MTIPAGYKCNQWGWFWKEADNSGPYYLDAPGTYYWVIENVGNQIATVVFSGIWEQRP